MRQIKSTVATRWNTLQIFHVVRLLCFAGSAPVDAGLSARLAPALLRNFRSEFNKNATAPVAFLLKNHFLKNSICKRGHLCHNR